MANIFALDGNGATVRLRTDGSGTDGDPFIPRPRTEMVSRSLIDTPSVLTDPGTTPAFLVGEYSAVGAYYLIANINTDVSINVEISPDGTNWVKVGADVTQTANGFYVLPPITTPCAQVRGVFVGENGGIDAEITFIFLAKS